MNIALSGAPQHAPNGLTTHAQFINWFPVPLTNGKTDKIPCDPFGNPISVMDPTAWRTADAVYASPHRKGFVLTSGDDFFCIDVDDAYNMATGVWSPLALEIISAFPHAYQELSYSGTGLHIIARGARALPPGHRTKVKGLKLEVYTDRRFIALTGAHARGSADVDYGPQLLGLMQHYNIPLVVERAEFDDGRDDRWAGPEDDMELIRIALAQRPNAAKMFAGKATFADIWNFTHDKLAASYPPKSARTDVPFDYSDVDAALMAHLSYFTGRDMPRMVRIFEMWKGYRKAHHAEAGGYRLQRVVLHGAGNHNVYHNPRYVKGPARATVHATITPKRQPCTNLLMLQNGAAIADADYPDTQWLAEDMIPEGCHLLIGKPKKGKSWMALQLAIAVSTGGQFMGHKCEQGRVLYLALEDKKPRIKSRLRKTCAALGVDYKWAGGQILFGAIDDEIPNADAGLYDMIRDVMDADPLIRLVIVDTLHKARPVQHGNEGLYVYDRRCVDPFTEMLAVRPGRTILLIHHSKKAGTEDPFDMASGSMGLTGACDGGLFIGSNSDGQDVLNINCRDGDGPVELVVKLNDAAWEIDENADMGGLSDTRAKIISYLQSMFAGAAPKDIAQFTNLDRNVVKQQLKRMKQQKLVTQLERGMWQLTPNGVSLGVAPRV